MSGTSRAQQEQRRRILARDGYRCGWCGGPATEADHVTPTSRGGADTDDNLMASCTPCNRSRGNRARPPHPATPAPASRAW